MSTRLDPTPAEFEVTAAVDGDLAADEIIPIELSSEDGRYHINGALIGSSTGTTLRAVFPAEEVGSWGDCSPWMFVRFGPAAELDSSANLVWHLGVHASMHYADATFFWNAHFETTFEVRE